MRWIILLFGILCCLSVIVDAFQTIILPRRPRGRFRITRLFFLATWTPWAALAGSASKRVREHIYSAFGPLSLLLLLVLWAVLLISGFGLIFFAMGTPFGDPMASRPGDLGRLLTDLYVSGTTLVTLGLGDVLPRTLAARGMSVLEAGVGLGFVALVIGYVPVLYGAFSRREVSVALLDARAGSPPTAGELLRRHAFEGGDEALTDLLAEWERWSAEILESHISYPILCYYRSQHDNQSWLSGLTAILDTCALLISVVRGPAARQAQLTFAMARHALVDLGHVFHLERMSADWAKQGGTDRLPAGEFYRLCDALGEVQIRLCGDPAAATRLATMRLLYEPHACALAGLLRLSLPEWIAQPGAKDQWQIVERLRVEANAAPVFAVDRARVAELDEGTREA